MTWKQVIFIMQTGCRVWAARRFIASAAPIHRIIQAKAEDSVSFITKLPSRFIYWISVSEETAVRFQSLVYADFFVE